MAILFTLLLFGIFDNSLNDPPFATEGQGLIVAAPWLEDFETMGTGTPDTLMNGWVQAADDDRNWSVGSSGVQYSVGTGPLQNHSSGGSLYLFTEASAPAQAGDVFDLLSPCVDLSALSLPALSFWYHMHGEDMGSLEVFVKGSSGNWTPVFFVNGEQQPAETDPWRQAVAPLLGLGDTVQLRFRGIRGPGYRSDMALDDVRIDELPTQDLAPVALLNPGDPACLGPGQSLDIALRNLGGVPIDFAATPATLLTEIAGPLPQSFSQQINSGTLAPFATMQVTATANADFSAPGSYSISVHTVFFGDGNPANDTLYATRSRTLPDTLPLDMVHFANYTGSNLGIFFPGWREARGAALPAGAISSWTADDFGNNVFAPSGKAARIRISGNSAREWLLSPPFVATPQTQLSFRLALTQAFTANGGQLGSDDSLSIRVSTDCGASFSSVFTYGSLSAISAAGQIELIDLGAFAGNELIVGFYASEGIIDDPNDVDVFLDDIHIREIFANDLGLIAFKDPGSSCDLNTDVALTITYANLGTQPISGTTAAFSVNGGAFTVPEILPPANVGDTLSYTFLATANLSVIGPHTLVVSFASATSADLNPANDTLSLTLEHLPVIDTFPYLERFENGPGSWFSGGKSSTWALGNPAKQVITGAASGQHAWTTGGLDTMRYQPLERSFVTSPCFDFSQFNSTPWVSLKVWWESEFSWDGAVLQSSVDGGESWKRVGEFGDPDNWYTDDAINSNPGGEQATVSGAGWTGRAIEGEGSGGWVLARHPLDPLLLGEPSVQFRIAFAADATFQYDGFAFDDFGIGELPLIDLGTDLVVCPSGDSLDPGPFAAYLWSTGDTTRQLALVNATGVDILDSLVWVQVTDSLGLVARDSVRVSMRGSGPAIQAVQTAQPFCFGDSTGEAVVFISGDGPFSTVWHTVPPQPGNIASGLAQGVYTVSVSDQLGCVAVDTIEIIGPTALAIAVDSLVLPACVGDSTGSLFLSASGGTGPYTYAWNDGASTEDRTGIPAGNYTLTLSDANGCFFTGDEIVLLTADSVPVADFSFSFQGNATVLFTENASANATSYLWDFGDGAGSSTLPNPSYTYAANGSFLVTLIVAGSCGADTFSQTVLLSNVAIADPLRAAVQLFPSPNAGRFVLLFSNMTLKEVRIELRDLRGRLFFSEEIGTVSGNLVWPVYLNPAAPSGVYFLEMRSATASQVFRFLIE